MAKFDPTKYLIQISKRDYLPVAARVLWFREEHPGGAITCDILQFSPTVIVRARIVNGDGQELAATHGTAPEGGAGVWKGRAFEKAETAAIGRALGLCGYGTQFTDDFDEGDHLADSPQSPAPAPTTPKATYTPAKASGPKYNRTEVIEFTKGYIPNETEALQALADMKKSGAINDGMTTEAVNAEVRRKFGPPMTEEEVAQAFDDLGKAG